MNKEDTWILQDVSDSDTSTVLSDMITINRNIENRTISIGSCSSSSSLDNMSIYRSESKDDYDDYNKKAKESKVATDERQERIREQPISKRRKTPTPTNFLRLLKENEKLLQNVIKPQPRMEQS